MSSHQPFLVGFSVNDINYNRYNLNFLFECLLDGGVLKISFKEWYYDDPGCQVVYGDPNRFWTLSDTIQLIEVTRDSECFLDFFKNNNYEDSLVGKRYIIKNTENSDRHNKIAVVQKEIYSKNKNILGVPTFSNKPKTPKTFIGLVGIVESTGDIATTRENNFIVLDGPKTFLGFIDHCLIKLTNYI